MYQAGQHMRIAMHHTSWYGNGVQMKAKIRGGIPDWVTLTDTVYRSIENGLYLTTFF